MEKETIETKVQDTEEKIFYFDKLHKSTVIFSVAVYGVCVAFLTLESILSGINLYGATPLPDFWYKLLFNKSNNSSFMLMIYLLMDAYCIMGASKNLLVLSRVRKCFLKLTDTTVSGFAFGKARGWSDGKAFSIDTDDVASVGKTDSNLVGRSMIPTLVINTAQRSYYLPGLENIKELYELF